MNRQTILPYNIHHVQLKTQDIPVTVPLELNKRYYIVFWWSNIPLGHIYVEKNMAIDFTQKMFEAIIPTLKNYYDDDNHINNIVEAYQSKDLSNFSKLIEKTLAPYLLNDIPEKVDVSVVVCTRNRSESLKNCIESLNNQICMPREVIIVDNAPSDSSTKELVDKYENVNYYLEQRPGLSFARNLGVKVAKYPILAYTDDDVEVDKLWVYRVWESFKSSDVMAMTGLVIASSLETKSQQIFEKHWGFNKGYKDISFDFNHFKKPNDVPRVWEIGAGANMAFRKDVISELNYFDERLGAGASGCSEDSEMWFRILLKGYKIVYNPRAVVFHEHRKEMNWLKKQLKSYMCGHVVSALVQDDFDKSIGYKKYSYYHLPRYYLFLILHGFPKYEFRYQTLWSEIKGVILGMRFYNKNKNKPSYTL
jgi:glycosyltransferase involved in cell wall biosynthesis